MGWNLPEPPPSSFLSMNCSLSPNFLILIINSSFYLECVKQTSRLVLLKMYLKYKTELKPWLSDSYLAFLSIIRQTSLQSVYETKSENLFIITKWVPNTLTYPLPALPSPCTLPGLSFPSWQPCPGVIQTCFADGREKNIIIF